MADKTDGGRAGTVQTVCLCVVVAVAVRAAVAVTSAQMV